MESPGGEVALPAAVALLVARLRPAVPAAVVVRPWASMPAAKRQRGVVVPAAWPEQVPSPRAPATVPRRQRSPVPVAGSRRPVPVQAGRLANRRTRKPFRRESANSKGCGLVSVASFRLLLSLSPRGDQGGETLSPRGIEGGDIVPSGDRGGKTLSCRDHRSPGCRRQTPQSATGGSSAESATCQWPRVLTTAASSNCTRRRISIQSFIR